MKRILLFLALINISLTQSQVSLVQDINPGAGDGVASYTNNRIAYNNDLLFAAGDSSTGIELWKTDGTSAGTTLLKSISAGGDADPNGFYLWQLTGNIYFSASTGPNTNPNFEVWETDGTSTGTNTYSNELNDNPNFGSLSSYPKNFATINGVSGRLLFSADYQRGAFNPGIELCYADLTDTNLLGQLNTENGSVDDHSSPSKFVLFNDELYFSATSGNGTSNFGRELYKTNTLASGTTRMSDINSGNGDSNPENLTVFNNQLYFTADLPSIGNEIFKINSVGSITNLKNINPGTADSNAQDFIVFNNMLYFTAISGANDRELWSSTGFSSTTNMFLNINPTGSSNPTGFTIFNGNMYFSADNGTNGVELWKTDGTVAGTTMVKDINTSPATPDSNPSDFTEYNGKLYFVANNGTTGRELWVTDGSSAGTLLVDDINPAGDSNPMDLIVANNLLFFSANNGSTGLELFKYQDPALSLNAIELLNGVSLFPNPSKDRFSVKTNFTIKSITIRDLQGKAVQSFNRPLETYNIETLSAGIYFANIQTNQGKITKKLIKE